jgi:hypothetical protein
MSLSEEQLQEIERTLAHNADCYGRNADCYINLDSEVVTLIAEVRRLREVVEAMDDPPQSIYLAPEERVKWDRLKTAALRGMVDKLLRREE